VGVMDRVGNALRAAFPWVKREEFVYLVMDNAGGHGTDVAWETYTADLEEKHKQGADHSSVSSVSRNKSP
jgi:glycine cleavage system regulatory protein